MEHASGNRAWGKKEEVFSQSLILGLRENIRIQVYNPPRASTTPTNQPLGGCSPDHDRECRPGITPSKFGIPQDSKVLKLATKKAERSN